MAMRNHCLRSEFYRPASFSVGSSCQLSIFNICHWATELAVVPELGGGTSSTLSSTLDMPLFEQEEL